MVAMRTYSTVALSFLCLATLPFVTAAPSKDCSYHVKEQISPPKGWEKHSKPPANHLIELRIGLPQPNFRTLEKHLYEVSSPDHPRYGQHLSKQEVDALVAPHDESLQTVNDWLLEFGFEEKDLVRSSPQDWVTLTAPVAVVEKMLGTDYYVWKHTESGEYLVRTTSYSLPKPLHPHIDVIQPTTMFGRFKQQRSTISSLEAIVDSADTPPNTPAPVLDPVSGQMVDPSCNTTITISCVQQIYNAVGYLPSANNNNSIAVTGYDAQYANLDDLQNFYQEQRPDAKGSGFKVVPVNGGINSQNISEAGDEADLDTQFAFGLSYPIPATFYSVAGLPPFKASVHTPENTNEPFGAWVDFALQQETLPWTISTSYGDDEQTVPEGYARRVCQGLAQLGARGVSVMFSAGDFGVGDGNPNPNNQTCFTNDGKDQTKFIPIFPASCPYVTSVGATQSIPEVAVSSFFSGGGFSNYFARPSYQNPVVPEYIENLPQGTYEGLYNPNGRGIPDVAAQGDRIRIWWSGAPASTGGTSAAAPIFAGLIAMLNDARFKEGKGSLGFLNPLLYSKDVSQALNDITVGHNSGCGTPGFNATKGWDPVSGLGTPNFGKLRELVCQ